MNKYAIYCSESQVKKAIELGAPIEVTKRLESLVNRKYITDLNNYTATIIPTAEEMIGWLEEQECIAEINIVHGISLVNWCFNGYNEHYASAFSSKRSYNSRKEATLAAIDAALEYLTNKLTK